MEKEGASVYVLASHNLNHLPLSSVLHQPIFSFIPSPEKISPSSSMLIFAPLATGQLMPQVLETE